MTTRLLMGLTGLVVAFFVICDFNGSGVWGFEYSGYCQKMCAWGRGGNLCRCSAVHFAGKRGQYNRNDDEELIGLLEAILEQLASGKTREEDPRPTAADESLVSDGSDLAENWLGDESRFALASRIALLLEKNPALQESFRQLMKSSRKKRMVHSDERLTRQ